MEEFFLLPLASKEVNKIHLITLISSFASRTTTTTTLSLPVPAPGTVSSSTSPSFPQRTNTACSFTDRYSGLQRSREREKRRSPPSKQQEQQQQKTKGKRQER